MYHEICPLTFEFHNTFVKNDNAILIFVESIMYLGYFWLSAPPCPSLWVSAVVCGCLCGCLWFYAAVGAYLCLRVPVAVCGCLWLSVVVCGCLWLSVAVCGCLWLSVHRVLRIMDF